MYDGDSLHALSLHLRLSTFEAHALCIDTALLMPLVAQISRDINDGLRSRSNAQSQIRSPLIKSRVRRQKKDSSPSCRNKTRDAGGTEYRPTQKQSTKRRHSGSGAGQPEEMADGGVTEWQGRNASQVKPDNPSPSESPVRLLFPMPNARSLLLCILCASVVNPASPDSGLRPLPYCRIIPPCSRTHTTSRDSSVQGPDAS